MATKRRHFTGDQKAAILKRYVNLHGTFYYLTTILDGYSRYIVHWEIRISMTQQDELVILQRALEKFPGGEAADH